MNVLGLPNMGDPVFIAKVIDFIVFISAIVWVFNKYGKAALIAHQEAQNRLVADAQAHRDQAEAAVAAARHAIEQAKIDSVRMIDIGRAQAAKLVEDERVQAREHAERILAHAAGELERERYRVRRELLEETVELAHGQAQDLARRDIGPTQQHTLVERLLRHLERARA